MKEDSMAEETKEDTLVLWWSPDLTKEDAFVVPLTSLEEGMRSLGFLQAYDEFLSKHNHKNPETQSEGSIAFMDESGGLKPWSYVDILGGGKAYTDPLEYLTEKYKKNEIIT
jgi:hypothetical protein